MTKRFTQQTARKTIWIGFGKRFKDSGGKGIFLKKLIFLENLDPNLPA